MLLIAAEGVVVLEFQIRFVELAASRTMYLFNTSAPGEGATFRFTLPTTEVAS